MPPRKRSFAHVTPVATPRSQMYQRELAERARLLFRLGYPPSRASARLKANAAWDFGAEWQRPAGLADPEIDDLVKATYLSRPVG